MRHRAPERPSVRSRTTRRAGAIAAALSLVAGLGIVAVTAISSAAPKNLVRNPGFEQNLAGWTPLTGPRQLTRVAGGHSGSWAAELSVTSTKAHVALLKDRPNTVASATRGQVFVYTAWVKGVGGRHKVNIRVREVHQGKLVRTYLRTRWVNAGWQRMKIVFTVAKTGSTLDLNVLAWNLKPGTNGVLVDDVYLGMYHQPGTKPTTTATAKPVGQPAAQPATAGTDSVAPSGTETTAPVVTGSTLFGSSINQEPGETFATAYQRRVRTFGGLDVSRVFYTGLPKPWPGNAGYAGKPVVVSFKVSPQVVLSGQVDAQLAAWFAGAPSDRDIWWSYFHEPEDDIERGAFTAAQYRAAFARIAALADRAKNPRLHSTLILMCWTLDSGSHRSFADYYAGSSVVDALGFDCYNKRWSSGGYADPANQFANVLAVTQSTGKPFGIAEFGSKLATGDNGAGRAAWLRTSAAWLAAHHASFVTYFDSTVGGDFRLRDAPSQQAWGSVIRSS